MEYKELQKRYLDRGIDNYCLSSIEDFEAVFNLIVNNIKGYCGLTGDQKNIFNQFIINYLNRIGLNSKTVFVTVSIYNIEEIALVGKENEQEECFVEEI